MGISHNCNNSAVKVEIRRISSYQILYSSKQWQTPRKHSTYPSRRTTSSSSIPYLIRNCRLSIAG